MPVRPLSRTRGSRPVWPTQRGRPQAALREALERTTLYDRNVVLYGYTIPSELSQIAPMGQPAGGEIAMLAAIKTPDEVEAIHAAVALCDAGHRAARDAAMEGATELEIWNHVHVAVAQRAGEPVVMLGDLLTGARTELIGGPPTISHGRRGRRSAR